MDTKPPSLTSSRTDAHADGIKIIYEMSNTDFMNLKVYSSTGRLIASLQGEAWRFYHSN